MADAALHSAAQTGQPLKPEWLSRLPTYGEQDAAMSQIFDTFAGSSVDCEVQELSIENPTVISTGSYDDATAFMEFLRRPPAFKKGLRAITVRSLSADLIKILGSYFEMDLDLWTSRVAACDREYFAAPLSERGPKQFSHFHLACVDFFRATDRTPKEFLQSRKLNHTTRLIELDSRAKAGRRLFEHPRLFVIRRISGHLRRDGDVWTFLYLAEPFVGFHDTHFVHDSPGKTLDSPQDWVTQCLRSDMAHDYAVQLCEDGFGLIAKILRDIKSTWKLMLTALELFLEDVNDNFDDQEFIDAAGFLHRNFLLSIDYFQRQLFYHERYVKYLLSPAHKRDIMIFPLRFNPDFIQESEALKVVDLRLSSLRTRTTTVLEIILTLNSIKQNNIAAQQTHIQLQDARASLAQGESIRKLTLVNIAFLPPSFIAAVLGMNTRQTEGLHIWVFFLAAAVLSIMTMSLATVRIKWLTRSKTDRLATVKFGGALKSPRMTMPWTGTENQIGLPVFRTASSDRQTV